MTAGAVTGLGAAAMRYLGMHAMRPPDSIRYDTFMVVVSVAITIGAAVAAPWAAVSIRSFDSSLSVSLATGAAFSGMDYTGTVAVSVHLHDTPPAQTGRADAPPAAPGRLPRPGLGSRHEAPLLLVGGTERKQSSTPGTQSGHIASFRQECSAAFGGTARRTRKATQLIWPPRPDLNVTDGAGLRR
ncbi:MHYT domain-containing protein [Streptomyces griseoincarnatus]